MDKRRVAEVEVAPVRADTDDTEAAEPAESEVAS
jgi:hypothetical protein